MRVRPGIVHRLDKDTSGVMIIAKNQKSFDWLKKQFKDRQANKKYLALVSGRLEEKEGQVKTLLQRASSDPTRQKVSIGDGKESLTLYKVIKEFKNYSLLEVSPKTGRLHQIRVHLAYLGHPVAGDAKYGPRLRQGFGGQGKHLPILPGLGRQFLHATELDVTLPDGQKQVFAAPLPEDLEKVLKNLLKD
jgi:23S rRNA pseudouridine1911/1915/1917 synthase